MPRAFELSSESSSSVAQFRSAVIDEAYWRARLAIGDAGRASLDSLTVDDDDTIRVVVTYHLISARLPAILRQLLRGDVRMKYHETWRPITDDRARGELGASIPGAPISGTGTIVVSPVTGGSRLDCEGIVTVRVPLVGGAVEAFIGHQLTNGIRDMQRFTAAWLTEHDA